VSNTYIPKSNGSGLVNSIMTDSGSTIYVNGNMGVNTASASEKLSVVGNIAFGTSDGKCKMIYNTTENSIDFIIN